MDMCLLIRPTEMDQRCEAVVHLELIHTLLKQCGNFLNYLLLISLVYKILFHLIIIYVLARVKVNAFLLDFDVLNPNSTIITGN